MVLKQKLYSIALVSAAMVLMLVSIAGAETLVDNPNHCEHCAGQTIAYTFNATNSGNLNITAPITVTTIKVGTMNLTSKDLIPNQSTPALTIEKSVDLKTNETQGQIPTYNYVVTNTGNAPLTGITIFDHKDRISGALTPSESVKLQTLQPIHLFK